MSLPDDIIRVFPRKATWVPDDDLAYVGGPDLFIPDRDKIREVHVSCTFSWDKQKCERLAEEWQAHYPVVKLGGPAYDAFGDNFEPGMYIRRGFVITSRGCIHNCKFCAVPKREGRLRELPIRDGYRIEDSNLLACSRGHIEQVFGMLRQQAKAARFSGGVESGLIDEWFCEMLKTVKVGGIYVAFDRQGKSEEKKFSRAAELLKHYGTPRGVRRSLCLVAFGNDTPSAAEERLRWVFEQGMTPFAMYYRPITAETFEQPTGEWSTLVKNWTWDRIIFARMKKLGFDLQNRKGQ